jgi:hypothetical protein
VWTDRYEDLRRRLLSDGGQSRSGGLGAAAFLHRGLAAWMRAWSSCAVEPTGRAAPDPSSDAEPTPLPCPAYQAITQLLVEMIFHRQQEAA